MRSQPVFAGSGRFDITQGLTEDEMRRAAPSIFATEPHSSRSYRFKPVPTFAIVQRLAAEGFLPVRASQSTVRDASRREFTKHMIRFRRLDDQNKLRVGDSVFEISLKNANDGTAAYDLLAGLLKIRCLNGLYCDAGTVDSVKIRHTGEDIEARVIEGTYKVLGEAERVLAAPQDWSQLQLSRDERMALAEQAHYVRFADADGEIKTPIQPSQMLIPRRPEDTSNDLWQVFNVLQENSVRGGLSAQGRDSNGRRRQMTSRAVKGIDQDVRLNQALWALTAKMAELKRAA